MREGIERFIERNNGGSGQIREENEVVHELERTWR